MHVSSLFADWMTYLDPLPIAVHEGSLKVMSKIMGLKVLPRSRPRFVQAFLTFFIAIAHFFFEATHRDALHVIVMHIELIIEKCYVREIFVRIPSFVPVGH